MENNSSKLNLLNRSIVGAISLIVVEVKQMFVCQLFNESNIEQHCVKVHCDIALPYVVYKHGKKKVICITVTALSVLPKGVSKNTVRLLK